MIDFTNSQHIINSSVKIIAVIIMLLQILGIFVLNRQVRLASENVKTRSSKKILLLTYWHVIILLSLTVLIIMLPV